MVELEYENAQEVYRLRREGNRDDANKVLSIFAAVTYVFTWFSLTAS
jgi:hypothetical protein